MAKRRLGKRKTYKKRQSSTSKYKKKRTMSGPGYTRTGGAYMYSTLAKPKIELKYKDSSLQNVENIANQDVFILQTPILAIPISNTASGRVGRKVTAKYLEYTFIVSKNVQDNAQAILDNRDWVTRLVVGIDKQTNGTPITALDVFSANNVGVRSLYKPENELRFKILSDKIKSAPKHYYSITADANEKITMTFKGKIRLNETIEYGGNDGLIGELKTNSIFVMLFAEPVWNEDTTRNSNFFLISYGVRVRYTDA